MLCTGPTTSRRRFGTASPDAPGVEAQELLDQTLKPFEDLLVEAVSTAPPESAVDVMISIRMPRAADSMILSELLDV
jgi:hypothetical protein